MNAKMVILTTCIAAAAMAGMAAVAVVTVVSLRPVRVEVQAAALGSAADEASDAALLTRWKKQHRLESGEWQALWRNFRDQKKPEEVTLHDFVVEATTRTPDDMKRRYPPKE